MLLKTIARGHRWFDALVSGEVKSLNALAARDGVTRHFVGNIIKLAFLAPEIVELIAQGNQLPELSTELLTKHIDLPIDWDDQNACSTSAKPLFARVALKLDLIPVAILQT